MWRNRYPLALLVGMQTGTATLENIVEVPQEVKNSGISLLGIYPKDTDAVKNQDTCTPMFTAAMSTIAKLWEEPRCPSRHEWIKKMWFMYTMEYYSAIRKDEYGQPGWLSRLSLPSAQGLILETWNLVPRQAPSMEPASPSAYVSASLSLSLMNQ